jgi:hypothetical protein
MDVGYSIDAIVTITVGLNAFGEEGQTQAQQE